MPPDDPRLPPLLSSHPVGASAEPFEAACRDAGAGTLGAGDLVWHRRTDRAALALVLEPEVAPAASLQMLPLAMVALAEALGQLMPPQVPVQHLWPGTVLVDGGAAASLRAALGPCRGAGPPPWLVLGLDVALAPSPHAAEPGETVAVTTLHHEGGGGVTRSALIEAFAHHFLVWLDTWQEHGFRPVAEHWLFRAAGRTSQRTYSAGARRAAGRVLGLDEAAGLIVKPADGPAIVLPLAEAIGIGGELGRP